MELNLEKTRLDQMNFAKKVISQNVFSSKINSVCGVDVAYKNNMAFCSAVTLDYATLEIIELKKCH